MDAETPLNPMQVNDKKRSFSTIMVSWFPFSGSASRDSNSPSPTNRTTLVETATEAIRNLSRRFSVKRKREAEKTDQEQEHSGRGEDASSMSNNTTTTMLKDEPIIPPLSVVNFNGASNELARPQSSSRQSIKKRASSRRFKGISRGKSQKFEITEEMMNLQRIIIDPEYRQRLIELLVPLDGDSSTKVRFCCAVEEYQREKDKVKKRKMAAHIVKTFVRKGSMFRIKDISKEHEQSLKAKKYETLETLKNVTLDSLCLNSVVAKTMKDILASEEDAKDPADNAQLSPSD